MKVYQLIAAYVYDHHYDLNTLAASMGIPVDTLKQLLTGRKKLYSDHLKSFCVALNVPASTFIKP